MSQTVEIVVREDVDIHEVRDVNGNSLPFTAFLDGDGDIIIDLKSSTNADSLGRVYSLLDDARDEFQVALERVEAALRIVEEAL